MASCCCRLLYRLWLSRPLVYRCLLTDRCRIAAMSHNHKTTWMITCYYTKALDDLSTTLQPTLLQLTTSRPNNITPLPVTRPRLQFITSPSNTSTQRIPSTTQTHHRSTTALRMLPKLTTPRLPRILCYQLLHRGPKILPCP
jgi:hypothetical protein